jgi:hypothetical protein
MGHLKSKGIPETEKIARHLGDFLSNITASEFADVRDEFYIQDPGSPPKRSPHRCVQV